MARWGRWESGEVGRWEVPAFVQGQGTQGESKIHLFVSVSQGKEQVDWIQDFLAQQQRWKDSAQIFCKLLKMQWGVGVCGICSRANCLG